jgi:hypothetical protein
MQIAFVMKQQENIIAKQNVIISELTRMEYLFHPKQ